MQAMQLIELLSAVYRSNRGFATTEMNIEKLFYSYDPILWMKQIVGFHRFLVFDVLMFWYSGNLLQKFFVEFCLYGIIL